MRVAGMVHGRLLFFMSVTMYLWKSGACTYALGRKRPFTVYIVLVYTKGLHLRSGPLCHDVLHSICHIKIKLHLTYSALSQRKSLLTILTLPHLISFIFCIFLIRHLGLALCYIKNIIILHSYICHTPNMIQSNKNLHKTWHILSLHFMYIHSTFHLHSFHIILHFISSHFISFYISFMSLYIIYIALGIYSWE